MRGDHVECRRKGASVVLGLPFQDLLHVRNDRA